MATYQVRLPVFEGPLDALLQLIERRQLEITTVSLAEVADQFLAYVYTLADVDAATLAQFIHVSARLLLLKSRALLPAEPRSQQVRDEDDPSALVEQLREYRRFKSAAGFLRAREERGLHAYLRPPLSAELRARIPVTGRSSEPVNTLLTALRRALAIRLPPPSPPLPVEAQTVTLPERIKAIEQLLSAQRQITLAALLERSQSRVEMVVTFLALLELMKRNRVEVVQERPFGEVQVNPSTAQF